MEMFLNTIHAVAKATTPITKTNFTMNERWSMDKFPGNQLLLVTK